MLAGMYDQTQPRSGDETAVSQRRPASPRRLVVRVLTLLAVLVAIDAALGVATPTPDYSDDWRMPRTLPTSELAPFIRYVDGVQASGDEGPVIAFVGASPTWGDAVRNPHKTVPAGYRREAERSGTPLNAFNLACNGQLLGDEYFVARRVASNSDVIFVQLTYHGFNRQWRDGASRRYPELADLLGVPVDEQLAESLGCSPSPRVDLTGDVERWIQSRWRLYGQRDRIWARALGSRPGPALFTGWQRLVMPEFAGEVDSSPSNQPFDSLEPDAQMLVIDEFASAGDYRFDPRDSEVRVLERLASDLQQGGKRAVFYLSPLNVEALRSFDLYDEKRYRQNVDPLRRIVETRGHRFIDLNDERAIPSAAFADVNHTTEAGSRLVAERLWAATKDLVAASGGTAAR